MWRWKNVHLLEHRAALDEVVPRKQAGDKAGARPADRNARALVEVELPRLEALNESDDAAREVEELNGFFRRYALAA